MKVDNRDVYEQLGNLFFAIATDQMVQPLEMGQLKLLISDEWLPRNASSDEAVISDEAHCIVVTIDTLQANQVSSDDAFRDFAKFYTLHEDVFTSDLKDRIMATCYAIVKVFREANVAGDRHFQELKRLFGLHQPTMNQSFTQR